MQKRISILLVTMISSVLYSQQGQSADLISQCELAIPAYVRPLVQSNTNDLIVTINADYVEGNYPNNIVFTGNVNMNHGNSRLQADKVQLHLQSGRTTDPVRTVDALGNVYYDNNHIILKGMRGWVNLNTKDINVLEGNYQMVGRQGRGKADLMKQRGENRFTILKNGSFTSCLPGSNTWSVVGSKVIYDHEEQVIKIWNARFKLGLVPVFYSPYLRLPIGDKHRTGFLVPHAKYSTSNYFDFYLPYYWNIAPNVDATITPHYIYKYGNIMWENEIRYLTHMGTGLIEFDYLPSDKVIYEKDKDRRRWLFYWNHTGVLDQVWRFNINYTKVSDQSYFDDFDSQYGSSTNGYTMQIFCAGYSIQNFSAAVSSKRFQLFTRELSNSYIAEPQLDINWHQSNLGPFDLHIYGQMGYFVNMNSDMPKSIRLHLEPTINLLWSNDWVSVNTEAKLLTTHYQQKNLNNYNKRYGTNFEDFVNRVLPQFKIDGKMLLKRSMNWSEGYTQTLEPRVQYLYVLYRDQSKVQNYNSTFLYSDFSTLFRERTYSGLDRIASANQVTTGLVTRVYDEAEVERFSISVGHIYHFTESHTGDDDTNFGKGNKIGPLIWASDTYWRITDRCGLRSSLQYDKRLDNISTGNGTIEYRRDEDHSVQLNYRYTNPEYLQVILPNYKDKNQHRKGISQIGAMASWPIVDHLSIVGAYYYDTNENKSVNQMLGLQYSSCCYAICLGYKHKFSGWNTESNQSEYDNIIGLNIELRGLGSNYTPNTHQMLRSNAKIGGA